MATLVVYESEGVKLEQLTSYSLEDLKRDIQQSNDNKEKGKQEKLEYSGEPIFRVRQFGFEADLFLILNEDETEIDSPQIQLFKPTDNDFFEIFWEEFELNNQVNFAELLVELTYAIECINKLRVN